MSTVQRSDGQNYAPVGEDHFVCGRDEFPVGVIGLDHGHIYGMCNGLREAGASIRAVWDPDPEKVKSFCKAFPSAVKAADEEEIVNDDRIRLIASASIPCNRYLVGKKALSHGKHFFADKPGFTDLGQIDDIRSAIKGTGLKYGIYYSERLHVKAATMADQLIADGEIGKVIDVTIFAPHRLNESTRPSWFFEKKQDGGILTNIGSHQIEQILHYSGADHAVILNSRVANYSHKNHLQFEDFGDALLQCDNGVSGYFRVDWFTPDGLNAWGDGRTFIIGTKGYIELRKYVDIARSNSGDHVYLVNQKGEYRFDASRCGYPFFGGFIRDCLDHTEKAMKQEYVFRVMELAIKAEQSASQIM